MKTKEEIHGMIKKASSSEIELVWIKKIMENQTDEEIIKFDTLKSNKIGLRKADSGIITYYNKIVSSGRHLSDVQVEQCKKRLLKYWKQYQRMMNHEEKV